MDIDISELDFSFADPDEKLDYIWKLLCQMEQKISKLEVAIGRLEYAINHFEVTGITFTESEHISYTYKRD